MTPCSATYHGHPLMPVDLPPSLANALVLYSNGPPANWWVGVKREFTPDEEAWFVANGFTERPDYNWPGGNWLYGWALPNDAAYRRDSTSDPVRDRPCADER